MNWYKPMCVSARRVVWTRSMWRPPSKQWIRTETFSLHRTARVSSTPSSSVGVPQALRCLYSVSVGMQGLAGASPGEAEQSSNAYVLQARCGHPPGSEMKPGRRAAGSGHPAEAGELKRAPGMVKPLVWDTLEHRLWQRPHAFICGRKAQYYVWLLL